MSNILEAILNNKIIGLITLIFSLIGIPLSIYLYLKSKKDKKPLVKFMSRNLIRDYTSIFSDLCITYLDKKIDNLTVTNILIWNNGRETIDRSDLVKGDLLRVTPIVTDEFNPQILFSKILFESNTANGFIVEVVNNEAMIDFEYFDFNEGAIIQLIHTGIRSNDLRINGVIKGCGKIEAGNNLNRDNMVKIDKALTPIYNVMDKISNRIFPYLATFAMLCITLIAFLGGDRGIQILNNGVMFTNLQWQVGSLVTFFLMCLILFIEQKSKIPKKFEMLNSHFDDY